MKWFYNLKIGTKLVSSFLLVAALAGIVGGFGIIEMGKLDSSDTELYENYTVPLNYMADISTYFQRIRVNTRDVILANTPSEIGDYSDRIEKYREQINTIAQKYEATIVSKEMQEMFAEFKASRVEYAKDLDELQTLAKANKDAEAFKLLQGDMSKSSRREQDIIEKMAEAKVVAAKEKSAANTVLADAAKTTMLTVVILAVLVAIALGFFIAKSIANPVKEVVTNINNADLNSRFNSDRKDEVGDLQKAFDGFVDQIKNTLVQVSESSAAVASASTQISSSTEELAAGAQEQSSQASEVATAVEEMTKTLGETNQNIRKVADGAKDAKESARKGGDVVGQTVLRNETDRRSGQPVRFTGEDPWSIE
jgi:methyl-accepting chemotaxis protein